MSVNVTSSYHLFMQRKLAAIKRRQEQRALVRLERAYPKLEAAFTEAAKSGKWIKLGAMQEAYK